MDGLVTSSGQRSGRGGDSGHSSVLRRGALESPTRGIRKRRYKMPSRYSEAMAVVVRDNIRLEP